MPFAVACRVAAVAILATLCMVGSASAEPPPPVPEIDPAGAQSVIALVAGSLMLLRGRRA